MANEKRVQGPDDSKEYTFQKEQLPGGGERVTLVKTSRQEAKADKKKEQKP